MAIAEKDVQKSEIEELSERPIGKRYDILLQELENREETKYTIITEANDAVIVGFLELRDTTKGGALYQREYYPKSVTKIELDTPERRESEKVGDIPHQLYSLVSDIKSAEYRTKSEANLWAGISSDYSSLIFGGEIGKENFELRVRLNPRKLGFTWGIKKPTFYGFGSELFESSLDEIKKANHKKKDVFTSQLIALGLIQLVNNLRKPEFVKKPD